MNIRNLSFVTTLLVCSAPSLWAEDAYFHVPLRELTFTEGSLPATFEWRGTAWQIVGDLRPYAVLEGDGEAYVGGEGIQPWGPPGEAFRNDVLAIRAPKGSTVNGRLIIPKQDLSGMLALRFKVDAPAERPESQQEFYKAKESYYRALRQRNIPGGAWFRHQEAEAAKARGAKPLAAGNPGFNPRRPHAWEDNYDGTYALFSGGRALSENLQLDRALVSAGTNAALVPITNLAGITVAAMDWKSLVGERKPATDPLATHIPCDQHALFFDSFATMEQWIDEADGDGTPLLQMFESRAEDADSRGRYQKQLCLDLSALSRLVGPKLISSAAFTGSDPYLRTGTDVGVLFESKSPEALQALLQARQAATLQTNSSLKALKGAIEGIAYTGMVSDDRAISSYLARFDNVVLVCNSRAQLESLISVAKGKKAALASQDEYLYFRQKYPRNAPEETAFLVLSDATIRRWCSPHWRIANSRRIRAAAALAEIQAEHLDELVSGQLQPGCLSTNFPEIGEVQVTPSGVQSRLYGTLDFLTPIVEMPLSEVTKTEADAYNRWRDGYQQNWRQVFDPIAIRFSMGTKQLSAEISVMPLIAGSEYRSLMAVSTGAQLGANAGDPHPEAMVHFALALNAESEPIKQSGNFLGNFSPALHANPLGWLGQCLAVYADRDPFWVDLAKAKNSSDFFEANYPRLPVALYCEVKNPLGLAAFLTSVRAFAEQTAPQMTRWENFEYKGQPYVRITASPGTQRSVTNFCIFYAATPDSLVLTLNESVLKHSLERRRARAAAKADAGNDPAHPWLGSNVCLQVDQSFLPALDALFRDEFQPAQQRLAWSNIPILNEWKRRYPKQDPVKLHEQFWQTKLLCPGGGRYVWNEEWQTMESTVYGHPAQSKPGPERLPPFSNLTSANLGVTFENQGLSARAVLERAGP